MFCFPLSPLQGVYRESHHCHSGSLPEGNVRGVCRLPSGSGLTRAPLQVLKIGSDCSEEL